MSNDKSDTPATRHFYVMTIGKRENGDLVFNAFHLVNKFGNHPTYQECIILSLDLYPNLHEVKVMSVSEMSSEDWDVFQSDFNDLK